MSLIFADALRNEATNYILAIPLIFAYFLYRKRKMLRRVAFSEPSSKPKNVRYLSELTGLLLCVMAVILHWYVSYTFTPMEYLSIRRCCERGFFHSLPGSPDSAAVTLLYGIGSTLFVMSSEAANASMRLFGIPSTISGAYGNPTVIMTRPDRTTIGFTLDISCSGIYPLMDFVVFAFLTACITRDKTWKKVSMFVLGLPLINLLEGKTLTRR